MEMKLAIVGSRTYTNYSEFSEYVWKYLDGRVPNLIISGGASGADTMAKEFASEHNIPFKEYPADWKRFPKSAGVIRNSDIVSNSTHVLAFPSVAGRGTQDTMKKAETLKRKLTVHYIK